MGERSEALYLAALAWERCWITAPAIPVQLFLGKFSSKARAQPRACLAPWAGYSLFVLRPENWIFPNFPRACLPPWCSPLHSGPWIQAFFFFFEYDCVPLVHQHCKRWCKASACSVLSVQHVGLPSLGASLTPRAAAEDANHHPSSPREMNWKGIYGPWLALAPGSPDTPLTCWRG